MGYTTLCKESILLSSAGPQQGIDCDLP